MDNAKDLEVVMLMYNLTEYSGNSKYMEVFGNIIEMSWF